MSLADRILDEIDAEGPMTVARFMELALYHPEHGYYAQQERRAGREWFTGPTLHPIFGQTLARGVAPLLRQCKDPTLIDAGTGSGELARDIALGLHDQAPDLFTDLSIVLLDENRSALERAQGTLEEAGIGLEAVRSTTSLPPALEGVLVANELLDAMPTHLCQATEQDVQEIFLVQGDPTLTLAAGPPSSPRVQDAANPIARTLPPGHLFELPLEALDWYKQAANRLEEGALTVIDYGAPRSALTERYPKGTLHAYRSGQRVEEFWFDPGQMDITYRVPFDEVAQTGEDEGLTTRVSSSQGRLLDALGIRELANQGQDVLAAKKLIDPQGAGGTFHALLQTRGVTVEEPWPTDRDEDRQDIHD